MNELLVIKFLLIVYGICLIPTIVACIAWPDAHKEVLEGKLGRFGFFLSAWMASPFILTMMFFEKLLNR